MALLGNLIKRIATSLVDPPPVEPNPPFLPVLPAGNEEAPIDIATDPEAVEVVRLCLPGTAQVVPWPYRPRELVGLYQWGKEIARRLDLATITDEVLELMHPDHLLPLVTYRRMLTYTAGVPDSATVYGIAAALEAYGPDPAGSTAYGTEQTAGSPGSTFEDFLYEQWFENNELPTLC